MTCDEVARELHRSKKTIQRLIKAGRFCPFLRVGRKMLWRRSRLDQWIAEHESPTALRLKSGRAGGRREVSAPRLSFDSRASVFYEER